MSGMNPTTHLFPRRAGALALLGSVALASLALEGCARRPIVVQAPPATVIQSPSAPATVVQTPAPAPTGRDVIVVKEAPPPPRDEPPPPPPPSASYTWVAGYWSSSHDGRQEWVSGHWEMPPRTGATWVAPRWERRGEGYVFIEGYWR